MLQPYPTCGSEGRLVCIFELASHVDLIAVVRVRSKLSEVTPNPYASSRMQKALETQHGLK